MEIAPNLFNSLLLLNIILKALNNAGSKSVVKVLNT
jgi:hypothetical protein